MGFFDDMRAPTLDPTGKSPLYKAAYYGVKLLNFTVRYLRNPLYIVTYLWCLKERDYRETAHFFTDPEFFREAKKKSSIRLGDGEFTLMLGGRNIERQRKSPEIKKGFMRIINEYRETSPYMLGIPPYVTIPNSTLKKHDFMYLWMPSKIFYRLFFNKQASYFNAMLFYIDTMAKEFFIALSEGKRVFLATNKDNIKKAQNAQSILFPHAHTVEYIETPARDTFEVRDAIFTKITEAVGDQKFASIVFIACGPASKILTYRLAHGGILTHDVGNGIDFALGSESHEWQIKWDAFETLFPGRSTTILPD